MPDCIRIDAPMREEYAERDGIVTAILTYRRHVPVLDAVQWVRDRLGKSAVDRDWSRVAACEAKTRRRYVVTIHVPSLAVPSTHGEGARADADPHASARHPGCDVESVRRHLIAAIQERGDVILACCSGDAAPSILARVAEYAQHVQQLDVLSLGALRGLYTEGGGLLAALTHGSTTIPTEDCPRSERLYV